MVDSGAFDSPVPVNTDGEQCMGHADMRAVVCQRCGARLETSADFLGRQFRVGQEVHFRNKNGVPYAGTVLEICGSDSVLIKYTDRSWSGDNFDEKVSVNNVAADALGLSFYAPRSRRKTTDFTPELTGDGKRYGTDPVSAKKPKPAKSKKVAEKKKAAAVPKKKPIVRKEAAVSAPLPPEVAAPVKPKLCLRKSVPVRIYSDESTVSTVSDHQSVDEDGDATESDDEL